MPIYAYRCASCGHAQDVLQKLSDPVLTRCPACGAETYAKQVTAAGFQLKGSGWYVTDFRGDGAAKKDDAAKGDGKAEAKPADATAAAPAKTAEATASPAPAPAAAPAPASSAKPTPGSGS